MTATALLRPSAIAPCASTRGKRTANAKRLRPRAFGLVLSVACAGMLGMPQSVSARAPLDDQLSGLLGGMATSISPVGAGDQRPALPAGFRELSASLATFRSLAPVPSATGAFRFAWDPEVGTFHRMRKGPGLADTAQTLGYRFGTVSTAYTHIRFDTLGGSSLRRVVSSQPAFSPAFLARLPCDDPSDPRQCDRLRFADDRLVTDMSVVLRLDQYVLGAAYGIGDAVDVSVAVSLNRISMRARAQARLVDPNEDGPPSFAAEFAAAHPCDPEDRMCVQDSFAHRAFGIGDIYLRSKWRFITSRWVDLAASGTLTVPSGYADEFLGFHRPTFTPMLIASKDFPRLAPRLNVGFAFRDGADVGQAIWIAGTDVRVVDRVLLAVDFLGFHDDKRDGINDDVLQSAVGFKVNLVRSLVASASFQFPLNRDGLRADVIYTGQLEWTF